MNRIKKLIYQQVKKKGLIKTAELVKGLGISRQAIHRYLAELMTEGLVIRQGASRASAFYILNDDRIIERISKSKRSFKKRIPSKGADEDLIFREIEDQIGVLKPLADNDVENIRYAFTEMLNNAIDHSESKLIGVELAATSKRVSFKIEDKGVGIFQNIIEKRGLANELEGIQDLLKGKTTTAPNEHSGEGIFFTSRLSDRFVIDSHYKRLIIDNRIHDVFVEDRRFTKGTTVSFEMDIPSGKTIAEIFREYTSENFQFDKSNVAVKLFDSGESYISRSQAKRLLHSMENFKRMTLDFNGVKTIGQAFADEIFRVYRSAHPDVEITWCNANENVEFMIKHALS